MASALGCAATRVDDYASLQEVLDEVVPTLAGRDAPLLVGAVVAPAVDFAS